MTTYRHDSEADGRNLLLGLAWLGKANTDQIRRLWFPTHAPRSVRYSLQQMEAQGHIQHTAWGRARKKGSGRGQQRRLPPLPQPWLWSLTSKGHSLLREHDQYPPAVPTDRGRRMYDHDTQTTELITRIIELGRCGGPHGEPLISGVYVEHEVRLEPQNRRPIIDALLILRGGNPDPLMRYEALDMVPWTRDQRSAGERVRRYAIENDRNSEPMSVITAKALAYMQASTAAWEDRYGGLPMVLWLVPTERRLEAILHGWSLVWPQGTWLMTVDSWLAQDRWLEYRTGSIRERPLFGASAAARGQTAPTGVPATRSHDDTEPDA